MIPPNIEVHGKTQPSNEVHGVTPFPSGTVTQNAQSFLALPGEDSPDPRWPSKFRWSARSGSSISASTVVKTKLDDALPSDANPSTPMNSSPLTPVDALPHSANNSETPLEIVVDPLTVPPSGTPFVSKSGVLNGEASDHNLKIQIEETIAPIVESTHSTLVSLGAWAKPLSISSLPEPTLISYNRSIEDNIASEIWPSLKESSKVQVNKQLRKDVWVPKISRGVLLGSQKQVKRVEDDLRFPWAAKMNPASRNLYRATEPEYLDDGTPKVTIPKHVLLQGLENQKEYILGQFYRCLPPPGGLIHAVFNKLWGRKCRITIRKLGESNYLFHIPDESTRTWVLQRGLWHVDDCLMFVASWKPEATLSIPEIKTIPIWVTLKKIPNLLYSISGISHIASGLGAPMATYKPILDPILMGEAKILVEVELSKAFPTRIAACDENGFVSMVDVEYAWLPTKCSSCGQLGHKIKRCLQAVKSSQVIVPIDSGSGSAPSTTKLVSTTLPISNVEVPASNTSVMQTNESITSDRPPPTNTAVHLTIPPSVSVVETDPLSASQTALPIDIASLAPSESSLLENTQFTSAIARVNANVQSDPEEHVGHNLRSNQFAPLDSSEEEDSESDSGPRDLMTPLGKRILRGRPVKPSAKAKEMQSHDTGRGRGYRGRGKRGGRG